MKVERHIHLKDELICKFTEELTENLVYKSEFVRVYVLDHIWDTSDSEKIQYPIRVTGRTIGTLTLDHDRIIKNIVIGDDCYHLFSDDYTKITDKDIGEKFEEVK